MKAVVLVWTQDERAFGEPFDGPGCLDNAHAFAADLRGRDDFPGALIVTTGDHEAVEDRKARIFASLAPPAVPADGAGGERLADRADAALRGYFLDRIENDPPPESSSFGAGETRGRR